MRELTVTDALVSAGTGDAGVPVRVYTSEPACRGHRGGVLFLHSGGLTVGSVAVADDWTRTMAADLDSAVVSVEYRIAPEHPYPAALEDARTTHEWLVKQADQLDIDPIRVAVAGEPAGAGLAAALAMLARDRGVPAICFQSLDIPALDDRMSTPSMQPFVDTPMWNRPNTELRWKAYLRGVAELGSPDVPMLAAPAGCADLGGQPPGVRVASGVRPVARRRTRQCNEPRARRRAHRNAPLPGHIPRQPVRGPRRCVSQRMTADLLNTLGRALARPPSTESWRKGRSYVSASRPAKPRPDLRKDDDV